MGPLPSSNIEYLTTNDLFQSHPKLKDRFIETIKEYSSQTSEIDYERITLVSLSQVIMTGFQRIVNSSKAEEKEFPSSSMKGSKKVELASQDNNVPSINQSSENMLFKKNQNFKNSKNQKSVVQKTNRNSKKGKQSKKRKREVDSVSNHSSDVFLSDEDDRESLF